MSPGGAQEFFGRLDELRRRRGLSYEQVGRLLGLSKATAHRWFTERLTVPPWDQVRVIVAALDPANEAAWLERWRVATRPPGSPTASPPEHPPRLSLLPHDIADFTGRRREAAALRTLLTGRAGDGRALPIAVVEGMAGAGKTRLAVHVLRDLGTRLGPIQLYVDLAGFTPGREPADPADTLAGLLRHLRVPDDEIPADLTGRAELYRDRLEGRNAVVLLDNAASPEQVRPLLPGSATCRVVITSRRSMDGLDGTHPVRLASFDGDEALALLTRVVGEERVAAEPEAASRLLALTGRLPLAVSLAARRLRSRPAWRLADLVALLEAEEGRLGRLATSDVAVRAAFAVSYDHLSEPDRRLFRRLAALPGRHFGAHAAAAAGSVPVADAADVLEGLLDEHLLEAVGPDRYGWHDLVALFAGERFAAEETPDDRGVAIRRGLQWYLRNADLAKRVAAPHHRQLHLDELDPPVELVVPSSAEDGQRWYETERANLVAAVDLAADEGVDDVAWKLAVPLIAFCYARDSWQEYDKVLVKAHQAVCRLGDRYGEAWLLNFRGIAADLLGRSDEANRHFEAALDLSRRSGDPESAGMALNNLGETLRRGGDAAAAIPLYQQDLEISRRHGDVWSMVISLNNIGKAELDLGRLDDAEATLREALTAARAADSRSTEAEVLRDLGDTATAAGDLPLAATRYRESAGLYEGLGEPAGALESLARHAEAAARLDSDSVTALVTEARRLLPQIDEPFASRLGARLDDLLPGRDRRPA